jgi:HTH-type transcriptional repressor of NAD biosynthesis genes
MKIIEFFSNIKIYSIGLKLMKSVSSDIKEFTQIELILMILFACISIVFSIIDFNHFTDRINYPYLLQWNNQIVYNMPLWKRTIMLLSGIISFSGVMSVVLTTKIKYSLYFWGLINSIVYGLFTLVYGYGGDAQMNLLVFVPCQFIGMYTWKDNMDLNIQKTVQIFDLESQQIYQTKQTQLVVKKLSLLQMFLILIFSVGITTCFYYEIPIFTKAILGVYPYGPNSVPKLLDTVSNTCNLVGQILLLCGYREQWIFWLAVNCMQIAMFSGINGFGININIIIMWSLFLINSLCGLYVWFDATKQTTKQTTIEQTTKQTTKQTTIEQTTKQTTKQTNLVIGKFYPFHNGHKFLVDSALINADKLYIIVCDKPDENPSGKLRVEWIKNIYKNDSRVDVRTINYDDTYDNDDSNLWATLTREAIGNDQITNVFTSENYGIPYSKLLNANHVMVDLKRKINKISGTMIRLNPLAYYNYLPPVVRPFYNKKIVFVGAESCGKTTMCEKVANYYKTNWVKEYGRELTEQKYTSNDTIWTTNDFINIAEKQIKMENEANIGANKFLFCDTDSFATSIWHNRYIGSYSDDVDAFYLNQMTPADLYILMDCNVPFVQDGFRDGEHIRTVMQNEFISKLNSYKFPYIIINGESWETKFNDIITYIDNTFMHQFIN